jgi:hypothetical protein
VYQKQCFIKRNSVKSFINLCTVKRLAVNQIELVLFIQLVCSLIIIACSSHYFGRQHLWRSSPSATEELTRQELVICSVKVAGAQLTISWTTLSTYGRLQIIGFPHWRLSEYDKESVIEEGNTCVLVTLHHIKNANNVFPSPQYPSPATNRPATNHSHRLL